MITIDANDAGGAGFIATIVRDERLVMGFREKPVTRSSSSSFGCRLSMRRFFLPAGK